MGWMYLCTHVVYKTLLKIISIIKNIIYSSLKKIFKQGHTEQIIYIVGHQEIRLK